MTTGRRRIYNPLALAVLGLLLETPMHPYEMAVTLRERHKDSSFKISTGTLYDVVDALVKQGWISAAGIQREGRRPERTIYALTAEGREQFVRWLEELLRVPAKEYPRFLAAVSYLGALPPAGAALALRQRADTLAEQISSARTAYDNITGQGVPQMFIIELEYARHMLEAELTWVERTIKQIEDGALEWPQLSTPDGVDTGEAAPGAVPPAD